MDCNKVKSLLSNYLENDLSDLEKAQLEHHVRGCRNCQAELEALKSMLKYLGGMKKIPAPKDTLEGVHKRLGIQPPKRPYIEKVKVPLEAIGVLASIILIIFFINQKSFLMHPKGTELTRTKKTIEYAPSGGALSSKAIVEESYKAFEAKAPYAEGEHVDYDQTAIPKVYAYINKVRDLIKELGGETEKQEQNKLKAKIPSKNLPVLIENLKNIPMASPTITGQKDDAAYLTIEFPQAE